VSSEKPATDVFDGKNAAMKIGTTVEDRRAFVESQQQLTIKYQGEALRAYLYQASCRQECEGYSSQVRGLLLCKGALAMPGDLAWSDP
jgi:hypothetical protein